MALDFPSSPSANQIYDNYYWDNTNSVWRLLGDSLEVAANFSNTATGTYTDGFDYKYVSFTSSGTLTVTRGGYADILVVGGGGGGGRLGGGGGAGGLLYVENAYLPAGSLDVVIGNGGIGASGATAYKAGVNGNPSKIWQYIAPGGGGGGAYDNQGIGTGAIGNNGASGGGAAWASSGAKAGGLGFSGVGNNGGGSGADTVAAGGGGGAGAVGADGTTNQGGNGGDGRSISITGSAITYAGGGGGGGSDGSGDLPGAGGAGGGGAGAVNSAGDGVSGTANTGGGGGGCGRNDTDGGTGGSGIVIVRVRTN